MTFLAIQALLPLAPSELGHVYEHGLLPNVSLSSAGHQPVSEDWIHALLLRHSSCLQTPIVPPISPAQDRSEAAGPGRTPGGQPRRKWVTRQRYSSQAQAPPCDRDEAQEPLVMENPFLKDTFRKSAWGGEGGVRRTTAARGK